MKTILHRIDSIQVFRHLMIISILSNDEWLKLHHMSICPFPICFRLLELVQKCLKNNYAGKKLRKIKNLKESISKHKKIESYVFRD